MQKNLCFWSKESKSPKQGGGGPVKRDKLQRREIHHRLSLVSSYIALYIHIFTNYVCFIHDDRRAGESCHRRKIGRFQEKRQRGAEKERAIGTRALICLYFLLAFSARFRRGGAILFLAALVGGIFSKKILAHTLFCAFTRGITSAHLDAHFVFECVSVAKESCPWSRSRARMRFSRVRLVID